MTSRDVKIDPIKVPDVECIIQEVSDRQRRKNNIILYNVSENVRNNRNDQVAADMELVGELLQMLDVSVDNLRTIRLGKFDSSRTDMKRPIKVCLPDGDIASKAFQRRQKLRTSDKFKNVFLVKDKTPMQLKLYREARQELLTRKAAGETDVYIKYINDVPKVNVRSLRSKLSSLYPLSATIDVDIVLFTETWLDDSINDEEILGSEFVIFRTDRRFNIVGRSTGGGCLTAFKNNIYVTLLDVSSLIDLVPLADIVLCKFEMASHTIYIANIYLPPDMGCDDYETFLDALSFKLINKNVIVFGDFNCPEYKKTDALVNNNRKVTSLSNFVNILNLKEFNTIQNMYGNILDLVFCNMSCELHVRLSSEPLVSVDAFHPPLEIEITFDTCVEWINFPGNNNVSYNFSKANFLSLYSDMLAVDWSFLDEYSDVDVAVEAFYNTLYSVIDRSVEKTKRPTSTFPPWFSAKIKQRLKLKEFYFKKWKRTKAIYYFNEFKRLRSLTKNEIRDAYKAYLADAEININRDPKLFWRFINNKKTSSRIPGSMQYDGREFTQPNEIVDAFSSVFASVYKPSVQNVSFNSFLNYNNFCVHAFSELDVENSIKRLKSNMTTGDDGIPSFFVRDCAPVLSYPLSTIFHLAISTSTFPKVWKISRITPVFKKGNRSNIADYRPISILPNFAKVFEHLLYKEISACITPFISEHQHGFVAGRSTITNLACIGQYLGEALDKRKQVDVIYIDFSKAFDCINHEMLLQKMDKFGFGVGFLTLIESYLTGRKCYVCYNGYSSTPFSPTSGVPQGSNLGPLLFNFYINDLLSLFTCHVLAYADDVKIFNTVGSIFDCKHLQDNLLRINTWSKVNYLPLNINKCTVVSYNNTHTTLYYNYQINDAAIPRNIKTLDLGVLFDNRLSFTEHISSMCSSASKTLGFVMRSCRHFSDLGVMKRLYYAYVRSKLEYASIVWYPRYLHQELMIERVQKKFLKYLSFRMDNVYPARGIEYYSLLVEHGFLSLADRRERNSVEFLCRILKNTVDSPALLAQINFTVPTHHTRYFNTFQVPRANTNILLKAPLSHMVRNANKRDLEPFL
ncbi:hypothetical protein Trydic_g15586 [Trypoxylus dichotomus]